MPRSAIETGCVDFVLRPNQIARELARLGRHPYLRLVSAPVVQPADEAPEVHTAAEEDTLRRIFRRLRSAHGVDFTHYKRSTLRRRLEIQPSCCGTVGPRAGVRGYRRAILWLVQNVPPGRQLHASRAVPHGSGGERQNS
jgi:hypothetical protein